MIVFVGRLVNLGCVDVITKLKISFSSATSSSAIVILKHLEFPNLEPAKKVTLDDMIE